ncbi:MAG: hypothetical protein Q9182_006597 [Xanthomendoza sp. 2 TL-2023]
MTDEDESEYVIPLQDQGVFGAGIRRQQINFVPSQNREQDHTLRSSAQRAGDRYLSIVLDKASIPSDGEVTRVPKATTTAAISNLRNLDHSICKICKLPINDNPPAGNLEPPKPHETSLAHQVCLEPSHPPSHLDRTRQGFKYLSTYGWDPDARLGLGATGTGIRIPIKSRPKNDTAGLGLAPHPPTTRVTKAPLRKLGAKQTRKAEEKAQKDRQTLRNMFYQNEDVERFLGSGG